MQDRVECLHPNFSGHGEDHKGEASESDQDHRGALCRECQVPEASGEGWQSLRGSPHRGPSISRKRGQQENG